MLPQMMQQGMAIIQDASQVKQQTELLDKIAKTLELLYAYQVSQQLHPFKQLMKMTVRRALTSRRSSATGPLPRGHRDRAAGSSRSPPAGATFRGAGRTGR